MALHDLDINLKSENPSHSFLHCINFVSTDKNNLLDKILDICSRYNRTKIFTWKSVFDSTDYLEILRKNNKIE